MHRHTVDTMGCLIRKFKSTTITNIENIDLIFQ